MKEIKESQQSSQGIAIGNQGNHAGAMPVGPKGPNHKQNTQDDKHIPNQERSSESNRQKNAE